MKKLHFSLMAILFALFAMVSFTACSSDDDDVPSTEEIKTNIVGLWQNTHISGWEYDNTGNLVQIDQDVSKEGILFRSDGTYDWCSYYDNSWHTSDLIHKYKISNNKIILYAIDGDVKFVYSVISVQGDIAVLEETLENPQYKQRTTWKRIK